jgi:anaerobic magnesium-protoporphyrin IX monomethyl ester cyclase
MLNTFLNLSFGRNTATYFSIDLNIHAGTMTSSMLFVEPPKDYWFLMGEYLPPPTALLVLAAYVEREIPDIEIKVIDCQAENKSWDYIKSVIESMSPSFVATSAFTCNAYVCARVAEMAKKANEETVTIVGGQHFTAVADESLRNFPEIDYVVKGEGELTLVELIRTVLEGGDIGQVRGLALRNNGEIVHTPDRPLIENLDDLPYPAYHLVEKNTDKYHFSVMAGKKRYLILEGGRGCTHKCSFCTQWRHWKGKWRTKSPKRIADEMEFLHKRYGGIFLWLTDDNFDYRKRGQGLWEELRKRDFIDDINWFFQARTDDILNNPDLVGKLQEVGNSWILIGVENHSPDILKYFKKGIRASESGKAMKILRDNNVFAQAMMIIGTRQDTAESIERLRKFSTDIDSDLNIYACLTPLPGTDVYEEAKRNGWIEDDNYTNYDMAHAIMPTETLSRKEVQEELFKCYREFYGSATRNIKGIFSKNEIKRRAYRHMAGQKVLRTLRSLI